MESVRAWLLSPPDLNGVLDLFGSIYAIAFVVGFVASAYAARPMNVSAPDDLPLARLQSRRANIGTAVFGVGLFFLGIRALQLEVLLFSARIWMVASALVAAVFIIRCAVGWRSGKKDASLG
jgi:hypothetical protein